MEPQDLEMPDFTEYTPEVCALPILVKKLIRKKIISQLKFI